MSKNVLFISRDNIVRRTPMGGNIDPEKVMPFVKTAQDKYIWPILGTMLYNKLQSDIVANSVSGVYKTLLDDYIVDTLVHYSFCEYLPFGFYNISNAGIAKYQPENTFGPSKNDIDFLLQKELQTAQFYAERVTRYLIAYSPDYPEYFQVTGKSDNIYPEKSQKYSAGWVM